MQLLISYFILFLGIIFGSPLLSEQALVSDDNEVRGKITMPVVKRTIARGNTYNKDGSAVMHSNNPMADPNRNVIISVHPLDFTPALTPTSNAYMTQQEQTFLPMVVPVTVGSTVNFLNEDQFLHSIHSWNTNMKPVVQKPPGEYHARKMKKRGLMKLGCDIHAHMVGYIMVLDTPYFTRVKADGTYQLENLPDGRYRIEVFHPLGERFEQTIELRNGQQVELDVDLSRPERN